MEMNHDIFSRIESVLKSNPKGMCIKEIAAEINMNRLSMAKYLEMLVIAGRVDERSLGQSKVYYLAQRISVCALLDLYPGPIFILNHKLNIIHANDRFVEFTGTKRGDIQNKNFHEFIFPDGFAPSINHNAEDAVNGIKSMINAKHVNGGCVSHFNLRFVPTVLEDGENGAAIMFDDITDHKRVEEALQECEKRVKSLSQRTPKDPPQINKF